MIKFIKKYRINIIIVVLAHVSIGLIMLYYQNGSWQEWTKQHYPKFNDLSNNYSFVVQCTSLIFITILQFYNFKIADKRFIKSIPINYESMVAFLNVLEKPIQHKLDRFSKKFKEFCINQKDNVVDPKQVFNDITQPKKQMETIVESVQSFYTFIDDNNNLLKVVLFFVEDDDILDTPIIYYPKDCAPNTPVNLLRNPQTPIMKSISTKTTVIVEDISNNNDGTIFARDANDDRTGSIICCPIIVPQSRKVKMVLSIFCESQPKYFRKKNKEIYKYVFDKFKKRLIVEYCLWQLKKKTVFREEQHEEATGVKIL